MIITFSANFSLSLSRYEYSVFEYKTAANHDRYDDEEVINKKTGNNNCYEKYYRLTKWILLTGDNYPI